MEIFLFYIIQKNLFKNLHILQIPTAKHILHIHADELAGLYYITVQYSIAMCSTALCSMVQCSVVLV
jgi:hypothetical protein